MTRDEILALADRCGFRQEFNRDYTCDEAALQSFAAAIAEHCAQEVEANRSYVADSTARYALAEAIEAIRAAFPAPETKP